MILKRKDDVVGTKGEASGEHWYSLRLLHKEDGMGVTLTDSILEAGFKMDLWQKNHQHGVQCFTNPQCHAKHYPSGDGRL